MRRPFIGSFENVSEFQSPGNRDNRSRRFQDGNSDEQEPWYVGPEATSGGNSEQADKPTGYQSNSSELGPSYEVNPPEDNGGPEYEVTVPEGESGPQIVVVIPDEEQGPPYEFDPADDDGGPPDEIDLPADDQGPPYTIVPCFTPGTLISTPHGERKVEELKLGDEVLTRDRGVRKICWVGRRDLKKEDLERNPALCPILVKCGALDYRLPQQDLLVSPNHRFLSLSAQTELLFGELEVLVAAKFLTILEGVERVRPEDVSYIHLMFDRHELVLSQGVWTESFQPSDHSLSGMDKDQREEILNLFPALKGKQDCEKDRFVAARRSLKKFESVALLRTAGSFC